MAYGEPDQWTSPQHNLKEDHPLHRDYKPPAEVEQDMKEPEVVQPPETDKTHLDARDASYVLHNPSIPGMVMENLSPLAINTLRELAKNAVDGGSISLLIDSHEYHRLNYNKVVDELNIARMSMGNTQNTAEALQQANKLSKQRFDELRELRSDIRRLDEKLEARGKSINHLQGVIERQKHQVSEAKKERTQAKKDAYKQKFALKNSFPERLRKALATSYNRNKEEVRGIVDSVVKAKEGNHSQLLRDEIMEKIKGFIAEQTITLQTSEEHQAMEVGEQKLIPYPAARSVIDILDSLAFIRFINWENDKAKRSYEKMDVLFSPTSPAVTGALKYIRRMGGRRTGFRITMRESEFGGLNTVIYLKWWSVSGKAYQLTAEYHAGKQKRSEITKLSTEHDTGHHLHYNEAVHPMDVLDRLMWIRNREEHAQSEQWSGSDEVSFIGAIEHLGAMLDSPNVHIHIKRSPKVDSPEDGGELVRLWADMRDGDPLIVYASYVDGMRTSTSPTRNKFVEWFKDRNNKQEPDEPEACSADTSLERAIARLPLPGTRTDNTDRES